MKYPQSQWNNRSIYRNFTRQKKKKKTLTDGGGKEGE